MSALAHAADAAATAPVAALIDVNYILINRIFVLTLTLAVFTAVFVLRRMRGQEIHPRITTPIKLSLLGFLFLYAEMAMAGIPSYRTLLEGVQTVIVLFCLAKLLIYLIVDLYLHLHTQREVPSFLRDTVRLVVYLAVGILALRLVLKIDLSAIVTTTTVITATIAFAMQSTLSNALSGFSIQSDKLLERQNWIAIKEKGLFGEIVNVGFRYITLRCLDNTLVMVPNSVIMQNVVTYYGNQESPEKREQQVDVMLGYDMPPERAKALLVQAMRDEQEILPEPEPTVRLMALNDSGITYQLKFRLDDPSRKVPVQDALYSRAWYAVTRAGYSFPFPHRQIITSEPTPPFVFHREQVAADLRESELFAMLDAAAVDALAAQAPVRVYGPGEVVVAQGAEGSSLFIVLKGSLEVAVDGTAVGTIRQDSFFGEMSLLTGEPRRATVRAVCEVWLAEVTKELMEPLLRGNPAIMDTLSSILAERAQRNSESARKAGEAAGERPRREDYLQRLKSFFKL